MTIWHLDVGRVRLVGADVHRLDAAGLRALVEQAVQSALETAPLPAGKTMHASIDVRVPSLASGASVAVAIASGVTRAVGRGHAHG
ncbi:MAG TPA: hypothetical protein VKA54_07450 [Gemmatimonadaceae bacterium]|nr:hypothetical protein [Gemmatimonadaceae bacterium]